MKKRNPQDTTLRNIRALKKRVISLESRMKEVLFKINKIINKKRKK